MTAVSKKQTDTEIAEPTHGMGSAVAVSYQPTPEDKAAFVAYRGRQAKRPAARIKVTKGSTGCSVAPDHPDLAFGTIALMNALGTTSPDFMDGLLRQIMNAASPGQEPSETDINFVLSVVNGIAPRDEVEAMLASQMAAVHMATMTFARRLAHVDTLPQQDSAERAFNKLARTFTTQVEALKRYRSDGQQTVRVERVTVEAGGKAIIGPVNTPSDRGGGRVTNETEGQPHAKAIAHAPQQPLWGEHEEREPVLRAGDAERPVPNARRGLARRTEG